MPPRPSVAISSASTMMGQQNHHHHSGSYYHFHNGNVDPATNKHAMEAIQKCAGITFFSALVDVYVYGVDLYDIASHRALLMVLRTIWKGFLAYNLFRVSTLRMKNKADHVPTILTMMTQVWQLTSLMVTLSATSNFVAALKDSLAGVGGGLFVIVLGVYILVSIVSKKETKEIMPNKSYSGHLPSTLDNIRQKGAALAKSQLMATAAMMLQTLLLPIIAFARIRYSLHETIIVLLNIPAPLALAGYLHSLRLRMIRALTEIGKIKTDSMELSPETEYRLAEAQMKFYYEVTKTFKADMTAKGTYSFLKLLFG